MILASELYSIAHRFDIGGSAKSILDKILGIDLPLVLYTDLKSLYDYLVKLGTIAEKRLIINIIYLR